MAVRSYSGNAKTTSTVGALSATATTFLVADGSGYPDGSAGPFIVALDVGSAAEEKVLISSRAGNTLTVATGGRGYDGTTAADHGASATVMHTYSALDAREANAHINATTAAHPATAISYAGSTDLVATNVEAALDELDVEKISTTAANAAYEAKVSRTGAVTGQVPKLQANGTLAFADDAGGISPTIVDAKGDLIAASAADAVARLAVGADGQVLTADAAAGLGVKWAATPSSDLVRIGRAAAGAVVTSLTVSWTEIYRELLIEIGAHCSSTADLTLRLNGITASEYAYKRSQNNAAPVIAEAVPQWALGSADPNYVAYAAARVLNASGTEGGTIQSKSVHWQYQTNGGSGPGRSVGTTFDGFGTISYQAVGIPSATAVGSVTVGHAGLNANSYLTVWGIK